jgi:hypothetical protein
MEMEHVYLPDSWVLSVETDGSSYVTFLLDAVLQPDHPLYYHPPQAGEQYAYARLRWRLAGGVNWNEGPNLEHPARDATGEFDFGNIDSWISSGTSDMLEGDWGNVVVYDAVHTVDPVLP